MLDPFYSAELLRETAAGIPNARLTLDDGTGHAMLGKDFQGELLRFLSADDIAPLGPRRRRPDLPRRWSSCDQEARRRARHRQDASTIAAVVSSRQSSSIPGGSAHGPK